MPIDSPELARKLYRALRLDNNNNTWLKDSLLTLEDGSSFKLPFAVIKRKRQPGKKGARFEFIDYEQSAGAGSAGRIYLIKGTLQRDQFKAAGRPDKQGLAKERLVKIQEHHIRHLPENAVTEYRQARQSNHLHIKTPTFRSFSSRNGRYVRSYTVMRRMRGCEMLRVISEDIRLPEKKLTLQQRFELSIALLQALKTQVHDHRIIHRDIKLDNILVNIDTAPISVSILDYGFAVDADNPGSTPAGNPFFASPEQFFGRAQDYTQSLDVYAMARMIALIFRVSRHSYRELKKDRSIEDLLGGLFDGVDDISDVQKNGVRQLLEQGLQADPKKRLSLESFLTGLQQLIIPQIEPAPSQPSCSSSSTDTPMPSLAGTLSFFSAAPAPIPVPEAPAIQTPGATC